MIGPLPHSGPVKTIIVNTGYNDDLSEIETLIEKNIQEPIKRKMEIY